MIAAAVERRPRVGGLAEFSTVDYPGRLSAVVFLQGCPWKCGYCHNPHLQSGTDGVHEWPRVRSLLERRVGLVDAVVFSGGEPTADAALPAAIREVRALGFGVGLHTAGIYPRRLEAVLPDVDWVGLDVKAPFDQYEAVTGVRGSGEPVRRSLEALLASGRECEVRTTFHAGLLTEAGVRRLARSLADRGVRAYALQEFRATGCGELTLRSGHRPAGAELLRELAALFPRFTHRAT